MTKDRKIEVVLLEAFIGLLDIIPFIILNYAFFNMPSNTDHDIKSSNRVTSFD